MRDDSFAVVGPCAGQSQTAPPQKKRGERGKPVAAILFLVLIVTGCLVCDGFLTKDPTYLDLGNANVRPGGEFLFGTDTMGRDIFSMIWYGGRISLSIGVLSTLLSTGIALILGTVSGCAPRWLDELLMRLTEILLSVPSLLLLLLLQAVLGEAGVLSLSLVIGGTSWMSMAKVVRAEVQQRRDREYILAAKSMGGGFFYILRKHLAPNVAPSILFMAVMNIRSAMAAESTLSFLGMGLPLEMVSWGSMLSLSEKALLTHSWWILLIPGLFLVTTLLCITSIGSYLQKSAEKRQSNL